MQRKGKFRLYIVREGKQQKFLDILLDFAFFFFKERVTIWRIPSLPEVVVVVVVDVEIGAVEPAPAPPPLW